MRSILNDSGSRWTLQQDGPEPEPDPWITLSETIVRRARHEHPCNGGCRTGTIEAGHPYQRLVVIEDGTFACVRICMGCNSGRRR